MMMDSQTALLIIDVQLGMFDESDPVYDGPELLEKIKTLIGQARSAGVPVIYVQHNDRDSRSPLFTGSPTWTIHPDIQPAEGELVVQKYYPDAFQETVLQEELEKREIKNLVIAGLQTEYCVDTTCRRAFSLGYPVKLAQDAHGTWSTHQLTARQIIDHHNQVLSGWFVKLVPAAQIEFAPKSVEF